MQRTYSLARENPMFLSMFLWEDWDDSFLLVHLQLPTVAVVFWYTLLRLPKCYIQAGWQGDYGVRERMSYPIPD